MNYHLINLETKKSEKLSNKRIRLEINYTHFTFKSMEKKIIMKKELLKGYPKIKI